MDPVTILPDHWPVPADYLASPEVAYRNRFAIALSERTPEEMVWSYLWLGPEQIDRLVWLAQRHLGAEFHGVGLELGAGCALLSAIIAKQPSVERVYAIEICEEMAKRVIPKVATWILREESSKVVPIFGSFNDLQLPDASVDFIVEIQSIHHSHDLARTLAEAARVLKRGGTVLCFDRCHPDKLTDQQVEEMLSQVYPEAFIRASHYPPGAVLTRRENGEHEYRLFEWKAAFVSAGLRLVAAKSFVEQIGFVKAIKGLLRPFPPSIRRQFYKTENATPRTALEWSLQWPRAFLTRTHLSRPILAPHQASVFLLQKP
jgi:ubiquinone/menaquinone biosynthesis C-methylase UbiE